MKNFALIGASGYVAPKHFEAIERTGNTLVAAYDPFDSVGIIDKYFPSTDFFTEFERFERHLDKLKRKSLAIDYVTVCSPNYLHDSHSRFALGIGADVVCEKPLALNPRNLDGLRELECKTGRKVFSILQLRLHPSIQRLYQQIQLSPSSKVYDVDLTYITSRGKWYYASWKGDEAKSGGIATNIGIHFFDMLSWLFGPLQQSIVHLQTHDRSAGLLVFKNANVKWFLSIDSSTLPEKTKKAGLSSYRSLSIQGEEIDFSEGFDELHVKSYEYILQGKGFGVDEAAQAIEIVHDIRNSTPVGIKGEYHSFAKKPLSQHPFYH
jgi:UDP-N-acetyl-2-amino-2-deoxyglucuronate dehydrogenase